jgi:hypothetical protein
VLAGAADSSATTQYENTKLFERRAVSEYILQMFSGSIVETLQLPRKSYACAFVAFLAGIFSVAVICNRLSELLSGLTEEDHVKHILDAPRRACDLNRGPPE